MITHERLKKLLVYNPCTGVFRWKITRTRAVKGRRAGRKKSFTKGYDSITIDGVSYRSGRLAWFYIYGQWPNIIDHLDHNGLNDSIWNISNGTQADNIRNYHNFINRQRERSRL